MNPLYRNFKTDTNTEQSGVVLELGLNTQGQMMGIRIARAGGANTTYEKRMETLVKPYKRQIQNELLDKETMLGLVKEAYVDTIILDWENMEDENCQPLPYSKAACRKLIDDLPELFNEIMTMSTKVSLYRSAILEADSKN